MEKTNLNVEYQIRQKVFHVMYIPVFPIGKVFTKKTNDQLHPVSNDMLVLLKQKEKVRTPWYSFSFPILLCLSLFSFFAYQEVKDYLYRKHVREEFYIKQKQVITEINQLSEYHYIELREVDNWITNSIYYLKIESLDSLNIYASKIESGIGIFDSPGKVRESYNSRHDSLTRVSIKKDDFEKLQLNDAEIYLNRMTYGYTYPIDCGLEIFGDGKRYLINDIYYFRGPVLNYSGKSWSSREGLTLYYSNYGDEVRLTDIENLKGFEANWNTELPLEIKDHFSLNADRTSGLKEKYSILLTFKDSVNNIFIFKAYKDGAHEVVQIIISKENINASSN